MDPNTRISSEIASAIPPDDPERGLTIARPMGDPHLPHIGLVGDTYTILLTGDGTAGRYTLIEMNIPAKAPQQFHNALLIWAARPSSMGWVLGALLGMSMFVRGISRLAPSLAVRHAVA